MQEVVSCLRALIVFIYGLVCGGAVYGILH